MRRILGNQKGERPIANRWFTHASHLSVILCILDFYVHYSVQRKGHGKAIIDYMLQNEHTEAYQLALDNPSVTLLGFMSQRYGLTKPVWQNTNFVVFEELFKSVNSNGPVESAPEGWRRPQTPRRIGTGATETRWLEHAISGHSAKGHAMMNSTVDADQTPEGALANRSNQARTRKAHILSSTPLW
ncbi:Alpha-tubulin N-acetyltransferase [Trichostrongylus colubriformis]|uniref:Alpha-tubulin N-acetyltransferase n=1 Tax=Trichostrongylus colubriformis TaxID=6319 RepID=A0AAN8IAH9_TRICO